MTTYEIGRLLRAGTTGFVAGCRVSQPDLPGLGSLVRVPLEASYDIYGLVYDLHIDDDGLVRQLAAADQVDDAILLDNRLNRNVPLEMSILSVGYSQDGRIIHLLPPRPPLSLERLYLCTDEELCTFTASNRFGYFRHILSAIDLPVGDILAAHLQHASEAQRNAGNPGWLHRATQELIILLRDDYQTLMRVMGALSEIPGIE
jgi:hypothetical protein